MEFSYGFGQLEVGDCMDFVLDTPDRERKIRQAAITFNYRRKRKLRCAKLFDAQTGRTILRVKREKRVEVAKRYSDPLAGVPPHQYATYSKALAEAMYHGEGWIKIDGLPGSTEVQRQVRNIHRACRRWESDNPEYRIQQVAEIREGSLGMFVKRLSDPHPL